VPAGLDSRHGGAQQQAEGRHSRIQNTVSAVQVGDQDRTAEELHCGCGACWGALDRHAAAAWVCHRHRHGLVVNSHPCWNTHHIPDFWNPGCAADPRPAVREAGYAHSLTYTSHVLTPTTTLATRPWTAPHTHYPHCEPHHLCRFIPPFPTTHLLRQLRPARRRDDAIAVATKRCLHICCTAVPARLLQRFP
jgi:hypothetical protein